MTRLLNPPDPIAVDCDADGAPVRLTWHGRPHAVAHIAARWRADAEWWRARQWREYVKLATDTGLLLIVFRDLTTGDWYVQRLYD